MIVKMKDIIAVSTFFKKINEDGNGEMPFSVAYKIVRLAKAIEPEEDFYRSSLSKLVNECGEKDSNGEFVFIGERNENIKMKSDKILVFSDGLTELLNIDVTLPDIYFSVDEFAQNKISFGEMASLMPFIKE